MPHDLSMLDLITGSAGLILVLLSLRVSLDRVNLLKWR